MDLDGSRSGLIDRAIGRPVAVLMVVSAVLVFGWVSCTRLPVNLLPDIDYPSLTVRTAYPGAAPEDVEDRVTDRLEDALSTLGGLVSISSSSRSEVSEILLSFDWDVRLPFAIQDVRERIDRVFMPSGAERPMILRYDPSLDPVLRVAVSSPDPNLLRLRDIAEESIERELEALPGVAAVRVRGGLEQEIQIAYRPNRLAAYGLTPEFLRQRLADENLNVPGGTLDDGDVEYVIRTLNEFRTLEQIREMPLTIANGNPIRLQDVAEVISTHKDREVVLRIAGNEAVEVDVYRAAGANLVEVSQTVRDRLFGSPGQQAYLAKVGSWDGNGAGPQARAHHEKMTAFVSRELPADIGLTLLSDQARFVRSSIGEVGQAGGLGGLLAILVCYLFLRRGAPTAVIAVSIPVSIIATFGPMFLTGVSLNVMSLGGLALGIGMLVDNSIVVLESIARCREEGDAPFPAAMRGAREVGGAVTASTLTTIAVFAPIVFVEGVAGQIFGDQALTVVSSLLVSLAVALFVIPAMAARLSSFAIAEPEPLGRMRKGLRWTLFSSIPSLLLLIGRFVQRTTLGLMLLGWRFLIYRILFGTILRLLLLPLLWLFDRVHAAVTRLYSHLIRSALSHPGTVLAATFLLALGAGALARNLGSELLPEVLQGELGVDLVLPPGSPLDQTDRFATTIAERLGTLPGAAAAAVVSGAESDRVSNDEEGPHTARITLTVEPGPQARQVELLLEQRVRAALDDLPELHRYRIRRPTLLSLNTPLEIELLGEDLDLLGRAADDMATALATVPGILDIRSSMRRGNPEVEIHLDRQRLAQHGLAVGTLAARLRTSVEGELATTFPEQEERVDIRVRAHTDALHTVAQLRSLPINPEAERALPLEAVAEFTVRDGPAEIRHIGGRRAAVLTASVEGFDLGGLTREAEQRLTQVDRPASVIARVGGQKLEMERALGSLKLALLLAIFLVYAVMAAQFESLLQPFLILLAVPLAGIGAILILSLTNTPLSVIALLGAVVLAGIVVNNAIVLVDRINRNRSRGMEAESAIIEAGEARLRPILMTTLTTVLGMLPLTGWLGGLPVLGSIGAGEGTELRAPMAMVVIAGLLVSTVLTLVVVPVGYRMLTALERGTTR